MSKLLWERSASATDMMLLAGLIAPQLLAHPLPFCLWLEGEMGAGKTTMAGAILHAMGLPAAIPVTSPTYAYLNEYTINHKLYAHMDLYRVEDNFAVDELGPIASQTFSGLLIEWPQQGRGSNELAATHRLAISLPQDGKLTTRHYRFFSEA